MRKAILSTKKNVPIQNPKTKQQTNIRSNQQIFINFRLKLPSSKFRGELRYSVKASSLIIQVWIYESNGWRESNPVMSTMSREVGKRTMEGRQEKTMNDGDGKTTMTGFSPSGNDTTK